MAAQSLGYKVAVLDPGEYGPAGSVADRHIRADYLDPQGLAELAALASAATTEFENVPAAALAFLARTARVSPAAESVAIAQDRIREKAFLSQHGFGVAPYAVLASADDARRVDASLCPGIVKSARLGYDGKGQIRVASRDEVAAAWIAMGEVPCIIEQLVPLAAEVSVVVARTGQGETSTWPVAENRHRGGILDVSIVPARVPAALAAEARAIATAIATKLDYRGVLCAEMFVTDRRKARRQRDRPAAAQQRPLHDRCLRHLAVRAAGARARGPSARGHAAARGRGDGEPAGRYLVHRKRRCRARARMGGRAPASLGQAPSVRQGRTETRPQDGACDLPRRERSTTRSRRRARSSASSAFRAPTSFERRRAAPRRMRPPGGARRTNAGAPPPRRAPPGDAGPLQGIRVLDLTRLLPGPVCTLYLADLGADVIKVEDTGPGDYARNLGNRPGTFSAFYRAVNRNKRSIALNLKDERGRDAFLALAKSADVIVESFRPGVVAALGVGYDTVAAINPPHRLCGDLRLRPERTARAPRRTRHQLPWLRRRAGPDRRARWPPYAVQSADRRPPGRRGIGGDRASRRARRRATDRPRALCGRGDDRCIARAQHLRAARARAMGTRAAAGHGPAHGRRAVLWNLPDA